MQRDSATAGLPHGHVKRLDLTKSLERWIAENRSFERTAGQIADHSARHVGDFILRRDGHCEMIRAHVKALIAGCGSDRAGLMMMEIMEDLELIESLPSPEITG